MPKKRYTRITNSPTETLHLGEKFAAHLKQGDIVYLSGELGSGKTVLVSGICQGLGVREGVTSSSFVIATEYTGTMRISHVDLYRLNEMNVAQLPIDEYIFRDGITLIEWADRLHEQKKSGLHIRITIKGMNKREFLIEDFRN